MYLQTKFLQLREEFEQKQLVNHSKTPAKVVSQESTKACKEQEEKTTKEQKESIKNTAKQNIIKLSSLSIENIPKEFQLDTYFSEKNRQTFCHHGIFSDISHVFQLIDRIHPYLMDFFQHKRWISNNEKIKENNTKIITLTRLSEQEQHDTSMNQWTRCILDEEQQVEIILSNSPSGFYPDKIICLASSSTSASSSNSNRQLIVRESTNILGGVFDLTDGSIYIGQNVRIEPGVMLRGPLILEDHSVIRSGAYVRGDVIIGSHVVIRGELKNCLIMDQAELCHPGYCGDSICGFKSHFGNQVSTANLNLFSSSLDGQKNLLIEEKKNPLLYKYFYDTGRKKIGIILGDYSQIGCSSVTDPCTLIQQNTIIYPLTRLNKGIYGPNVIVKNKPMEKGVLQICAFTK